MFSGCFIQNRAGQLYAWPQLPILFFVEENKSSEVSFSDQKIMIKPTMNSEVIHMACFDGEAVQLGEITAFN